MMPGEKYRRYSLQEGPHPVVGLPPSSNNNVQHVHVSSASSDSTMSLSGSAGHAVTNTTPSSYMYVYYNNPPRRYSVQGTSNNNSYSVQGTSNNNLRRIESTPVIRGSSTVAIDNKIEQAMDLVKSHLMYAVREEVEVLKEQIKELSERNAQLEYENSILKAAASQETLSKLSQPRQPPASSS